MSNSILEAMSCGLPIITTDTGGSKELIKGNGYIIKKSDSESIRQAIEQYLKNPKTIKIQGNKSRKITESNNWEKIAQDYIMRYNTL